MNHVPSLLIIKLMEVASGVLATSLKQSMERLRAGCLFEKYWTKSVRKKNIGDAPNPDSKSMHKLGVCMMSIEPHIFEVTLYTVKGSSVTFLPPVNQSNMQRPPMHPNYYQSPIAPTQPTPRPVTLAPLLNSEVSSPTGHSLTPASIPTAPQSLPQGIKPTTQSAPSSERKTNSLSGDASLQMSGPAESLIAPQQQQNTYQHSIAHQPPQLRPLQEPYPVSQPAPPAPDTVSSTNPVIQMLAQRASTNPDLKSLMKVVANGHASESELKAFQRHIDELNSMIKRTQSSSGTPNRPLPSATAPVMHTRPMPVVHQSQTWSASQGANIKQEPLSQYYSQQPPYQKPKPPVASKPDISAVVFDFTGGNGDRYLFPRKSVLEYLPGSPQVLISFLVTRKGAEADQGSYKSSVQYYEPVTIKLSCMHHKVLEPLAKVVESQDVVCKYMEEVMVKGTRAECVYLMTRLPKNGGEEQIEETVAPEAQPMTDYSPPNSLLPLRPAIK